MRRREEPQRFYWHLIQLLHFTAGDGKPSEYQISKGPLLISGAHMDFELTNSLLAFEESVAPPFLRVLRTYIQSVSEDSSKT